MELGGTPRSACPFLSPGGSYLALPPLPGGAEFEGRLCLGGGVWTCGTRIRQSCWSQGTAKTLAPYRAPEWNGGGRLRSEKRRRGSRLLGVIQRKASLLLPIPQDLGVGKGPKLEGCSPGANARTTYCAPTTSLGAVGTERNNTRACVQRAGAQCGGGSTQRL